MEILSQNAMPHLPKGGSQKIRHIDAAISEESQYQKSAGFDRVWLPCESAAGLDLDGISVATEFLGFSLRAPLMIAPMTGGHIHGQMLNERWARAAEHFGLAMGVGSQRLAVEDHSKALSFQVRKQAPKAVIFANLGAAQFAAGYTSATALNAVRMIDANGLFIHLNPLQEACQEHGDTRFSGIVDAIARVVKDLHRDGVKVLVREVGFGLSKRAAQALIGTGIDGLDCAGAGGTSWAKVEAMCATSKKYQRLGQVFGEWGIPTVDSIANVRAVSPNVPLIATGGIRSGVDVAKSLALGADMAAMARPMLLAALSGEDELFWFIETIIDELKTAMFASGAKNISALKEIALSSPEPTVAEQR